MISWLNNGNFKYLNTFPSSFIDNCIFRKLQQRKNSGSKLNSSRWKQQANNLHASKTWKRAWMKIENHVNEIKESSLSLVLYALRNWKRNEIFFCKKSGKEIFFYDLKKEIEKCNEANAIFLLVFDVYSVVVHCLLGALR